MMEHPQRAATGRYVWGLAVAVSASAPAYGQDCVWQEQDGLVVIELESGEPLGDWVEEAAIEGHTGAGYFRWNGPDQFGSPGHGTFGFDIEIGRADTYHLRIRNRHDHPDSTEANDVWVRMDGGAWVKVYSRDNYQWTWSTWQEFSTSDHQEARYALGAGTHRIEFSGRSRDFIMDRLHLFVAGHPDGTDPGAAESRCEGDDRPPVARIRVTPDEIPADDRHSTVITLDSRASFDPDGDALTTRWLVRGGRFVEGTGELSPVARVTLPGTAAWPVQLVVRTPDGSWDRTHAVVDVADRGGDVGGELVAWHPMEVAFEGPYAEETDEGPNPFSDYRLRVDFTGPQGQTYRIPGFFDGDGNGRGAGVVWKARFAPDAAGIWNYEASFRTGPHVAVQRGQDGTPTAFDGATGSFAVLQRMEDAPGFLSQGRLEYVGEHYLKFRDGGYFIKGGTDSPENLLGYRGFDDIRDVGGSGILHEYAPHRGDWNPGDPLFTSSTTGYDSKGIIGALNYLGEMHVNSVYFLPMNLGGDGQDTCPYVAYEGSAFNKRHFDVSRLHQWNQVFEHAQRQGILLHFVLAETEPANENWLDDGAMGVERKLFYRELIARFGHVLGIKWNLSEENDYSVARLAEFADWIDYWDAYDHPIAVHTHPDDFDDYEALVGNPLFSATSIQYSPDLAGTHAEQWCERSAATGRRWIIDMDENNPWHTGLTDTNADELRKQVLYDVLFSGGQIEWYAGYHDLPLGGDLRLENFRTREAMWKYMWYARKMIQSQLPFWEMTPSDELLSGEAAAYGGGQVWAKAGDVYAIYLPDASSTSATIDLTRASGEFRTRWYDPRKGKYGEGGLIEGGGVRSIGLPPTARNDDWVLLIQRP